MNVFRMEESMTHEIMIKELSEIVNKFDVFRTIALDINWVDVKEYQINWHRNFPIGFLIDLYSLLCPRFILIYL